MVIKRRDFQKAAAFIHEFLLKMNEDVGCAELRDTLNLALLHMQKYYRVLQSRSQEKNAQSTLSLTARGLSPMTPFVDAPDKFRWRWVNLDNARLPSNMSVNESINMNVLPPVILAVKSGNLGMIKELIDQDVTVVNECDGLGRTGLMYAVHCFQNAALSFLLEHDANVNATAHDGSTALHHACHDSNVVALSLLLDYRADITISDVQGRAPIHWAVTTKSTGCLQMLLEKSADPSLRDNDGMTPCMWACRMDNIKHFELLCRSEYQCAEQDGIERDMNGRTWMHWAVRRTEPLECLQTLLTPESASYKDEDGKTVLMLAAEIGSLAATRLIIEIAGVECVDDHDSQDRTALHLATIGGHGDVVNFLLEKGADINQPDRYNGTAWDYARTRQLHYCQLIIMSHQRQRLLSNPMAPLPNGMGLLLQAENGVRNDFSRMSFQTRSEQSTPITPPHPPKRPRTNSNHRILTRRANSLTSSVHSHDQEEQRSFSGRISNSAGHDRKKERIEVNLAPSTTGFLSSRQDSMMTDDTDFRNVMNDVDINGDDDIDNVSVGGMDVSDIEDNEMPNGSTDPSQDQVRVPAAAHPMGLRRQQQQQQLLPHNAQQPSHLPIAVVRPPQAAPSYTQPLEPPHSHSQYLEDLPDERPAIHPQPLQAPHANKPYYHPEVPPRHFLRAQQHHGGRGPMPSPPNLDPQRPHMIRQQQPLPPRPSQRDTAMSPPSAFTGGGDGGRGEVVVSPTLSSQSSDQISSRTQVSVGVGPTQNGVTSPGPGGDSGDPEQNRPNSGGNKPPGILEGRRIPPPPMLTPLHNAPKPPPPDLSDRKDRKKKKKKKIGGVSSDKEQETKVPPQNPLEIPPPRGFAAPLHPGRGHSAAPPAPRYSKGPPQHHEASSRYVDENLEEIDKPPVVNGFAVPIRENTNRSARPGQRVPPMEIEQANQVTDTNNSNHGDGLKESIMEEDGEEEIDGDEMVGQIIPPPQAFRGSRPLAQSVPQDKNSMKMIPTSAKPPLPSGNRNSASVTRRSGEKNASPGRRPRPPTSKPSKSASDS